jgi:peptidoglycan hydrolase-like protein with peptidoglycan-binding domain
MGYDPGRADGTVDKRTESAIYAYQREFGLPADGRPSLKVLMSLRANAVSPEQSNQGPQLEPIKVTLAPDMMRSEKTLFYECERELNVQRRQEGIAEIKLITAKEAAEAAQAANAELVAKVGQDMIGGMYQPTEVRIANKLAELGSVNAAIANMQNNVVAQQSAVSALTACASGKKLAKK